jgi:hypothetical protein
VARRSDTLETLARPTEAVAAAARGMDVAGRGGTARSLGAYLAGNVAEPLIRLGIFTEAEDLAPVGQWSYE